MHACEIVGVEGIGVDTIYRHAAGPPCAGVRSRLEEIWRDFGAGPFGARRTIERAKERGGVRRDGIRRHRGSAELDVDAWVRDHRLDLAYDRLRIDSRNDAYDDRRFGGAGNHVGAESAVDQHGRARVSDERVEQRVLADLAIRTSRER